MLAWLRDFERRLQYAAPPIKEWLRESADHPQYGALPFIAQTVQLLQDADLETAWKKALHTAPGSLADADAAVLSTLGTHLGKSDAPTQLQCIQETVAVLEESRKVAVAAVQKADKLYLTLGVSGGMGLALLLL